MAVTDYGIGALARRAGCTVQGVRWYESVGLLPAPARSAGNQRRYGRAHLDRLAFIRHARALGFSLDDVRELLALADDPQGGCGPADAVARRHLDRVETRMAQLERLRAELQRMVTECRHGRIAECRVIEVLADDSHAHCLDSDHGVPESGPARRAQPPAASEHVGGKALARPHRS